MKKNFNPHLPSNLCFRKSNRAFCIMSVTLSWMRKSEERRLTTERKKPKVRKEVENKDIANSECPSC